MSRDRCRLRSTRRSWPPAGSSAPPISFGESHPGAGNADPLVARLDANGERELALDLGSSSTDVSESASFDDAGGAWVAGWVTGPLTAGGITRGHVGGADAYLVHYDEGGAADVVEVFGGMGDDKGLRSIEARAAIVSRCSDCTKDQSHSEAWRSPAARRTDCSSRSSTTRASRCGPKASGQAPDRPTSRSARHLRSRRQPGDRGRLLRHDRLRRQRATLGRRRRRVRRKARARRRAPLGSHVRRSQRRRLLRSEVDPLGSAILAAASTAPSPSAPIRW